MEVSSKEQRRLLKAFWAECDRVYALQRRLLFEDAERRVEFFIEHGVWPPPLVLPSSPEFPSECVDMVCGARGRRKGTPCQCKELYRNGRCKWHGGASTGPKTEEGKTRSTQNLLLPKVTGR